MKLDRIGFYHEVEIRPEAENQKYRGLRGVVLGISEEAGVIHGYAVLIHGEYNSLYFDEKDLMPTGAEFKREDFY